MKFFHQFYFILYNYYYNRAKFITNTIKLSAEGNASSVIGISFSGWILLIYHIFIKIWKLQNTAIQYGNFIIILIGLIFFGLINNYFDNHGRYLIIYKEYLNKDVKKSKIIFLAVIFFLSPYFLLIFFNLIGWL